jgi:ArsR family transcriptional regulator, arsenate/arsenite/antimonite-responsive transcriptional repressor
MIRLARHSAQLAALGHVARLSVLRAVVQAGADGASLSDLHGRLGIPLSTLSHHIDRLVATGLLATHRTGKFAIHTANFDALRELTEYVWDDCCKRGKI